MIARMAAFAALPLLLAGCGGQPANRLDALRQQPEETSLQVAAGFREASACLIDRELRRSYQVVPNFRDNERRATLTGYYVGGVRRPAAYVYFEYDVAELATGASRISIKRADAVRWSAPAAARLQEDLTACGIALRA
jgi:hypothetical protein